MKKHDEKSAPTTVVETDAPTTVGTNAIPGRSAVPLDAPLGSKLDGMTDAVLRESVAARLRLIEANLLNRLEPEAEAEAAADETPTIPVIEVVDVAKARAIAAQLKKKPQA